jgi:hypothetical protein
LEFAAYKIQEIYVYLVKTKVRGKGLNLNKKRAWQVPVTLISTVWHCLKNTIYGGKEHKLLLKFPKLAKTHLRSYI